MRVPPYDQNAQLDKARDDGGDGRTLHAQRRRAEQTENENGVENEIGGDGTRACHHGHDRVSRLAHIRGVGLRDGVRDQTQQHDPQIFLAESQRQYRVKLARRILHLQEPADELVIKDGKDGNADRACQKIDEKLEAEGVALTVDVARAVELGGKNTRRRDRTEDEQVEDEDELVDDRHARHRLGRQPPDHDVVEQVD